MIIEYSLMNSDRLLNAGDLELILCAFVGIGIRKINVSLSDS